jgi:poly(A) polymerase
VFIAHHQGLYSIAIKNVKGLPGKISMDTILDVIETVFPLETQDERIQRTKLTADLEDRCLQWLLIEEPTSFPSKLLPFGSSILGVVTNESDLDTVLLLPDSISRERFFESFTRFITDSPGSLKIESVMAVPDAHVPVLKLIANGLPVDILPCLIPADDLRALLDSQQPDGRLDFGVFSLENLDAPSLLALNGVRVGRTLVDSIRAGRVIADDERVESGDDRLAKFRICLRVVKHWAKERGVYSNAMGFFGGVTWAILLVRTCLALTDSKDPLIDKCSERQLICSFFKGLHEQVWGVPNPVSLRSLPPQLYQYISSLRQSTPSISATGSPNDSESGQDSNNTEEAMWDPINSEADKRALMPILTPVAPFMNSTFNVVPTTHRILLDEFRRAYQITSLNPGFEIGELCAPVSISKFSPLAISLTLWVTEPSKQRLLFIWESVIASKIRVLLYHLERLSGVVCRPFPNPIKHSQVKTEYCVGIACLPLNQTESRQINFNHAVGQFHGALVTALESRPDWENELRKMCRLDIRLRRF